MRPIATSVVTSLRRRNPARAEWYAQHFAGMPERGKPGTVLKTLTRELGIGGLGCGCNKVATKMDEWGPDECWRHAAELVRGPLLEVSVMVFNLPKPPVWLDPEFLPESLLAYVVWRADKTTRWPAAVKIPEPPALDLQPRHSRAIVTVATGDAGRAMLAISGPLMEAYAARVGADFIACDWPGSPAWPMSAKYGAWRALDHCDRIAYVDADVILRPAAVNLFDACQPDEVGAYDELAFHRLAPQFKIERDYRSLRERYGFPHRPVRWYCNAGVLILPRAAQHLLQPPAELPPYHCAEQDLLNARIQAAEADGLIKFRIIDRRYNWQHWIDKGFKSAPADAVLHFSGMWNRDDRLAAMREWAA